jgi:hypothetical protein
VTHNLNFKVVHSYLSEGVSVPVTLRNGEDQVRVGLIEYENKLYLSRYGE